MENLVFKMHVLCSGAYLRAWYYGHGHMQDSHPQGGGGHLTKEKNPYDYCEKKLRDNSKNRGIISYTIIFVNYS